MADDLRGEPPYYVAQAASLSPSVYHATDDCQALKDSRERAPRYIRWHDLDPCEYCYTGRDIADEYETVAHKLRGTD